jgi:hypothetical protein
VDPDTESRPHRDDLALDPGRGVGAERERQGEE